MPFAEKPPACAGCPLAEVGLGYVPGEGPADARIAFVGQGPGIDEASASTPRPFIGASGRHLFGRWAAEAGIPRSLAWVDNSIRCFKVRRTKEGRVARTPTGRYIDQHPTQREQAECYRRHWGPTLASLPNLEVVVWVGMPAAQFGMGKRMNVNVAGSFEKRELPPLEVHRG